MSKNKIQIWMRVEEDGEPPWNERDQRIRIIQPNGKCFWADGYFHNNTCWGDQFPCWKPHYVNDVNLLIKKMKAYDKINGFKTVKIGEI